MRRWTGRRAGRALAVLVVAFAITVAARPAPIASGPRPMVERASAVADRTVPALPHVSTRFATLPYLDELGRPGTWVLAASAKPLRMTVEREVSERFGLEAVGGALEQWNDTPGSDFSVTLSGITDAGVEQRLRDGVNRVFIDRRDCGERFLGRAHLHTAEVEVREGRPVAWVTEVDIGICERMSADLLVEVVGHELAHVAGVGHLCDPDEDCWTPQMGEDNRCRLMATAAYACQERQAADEEAIAYLHPRLPRIAGPDLLGTVAAVASARFPGTGTADRVVVTDVDAPLPLRAAAAVLAGIDDVPHLLADDACTSGRDGAELNRLAAIDATVVLVGDLPGACEDELRVGWQLEVERLGDVDAVTEAIATRGEPAPTRLVVAPAAGDDDQGVPSAALAVPAAIGLGAPLVVAEEGQLRRSVAEVLRQVPSITGIVVLESGRSISAERISALETEVGVRVRHIAASDSLELGLKISAMRDVFRSGTVRPVLVAADRPEDAAAAMHLAAATGAPILPVFTGAAAPDVRIASFLDERADGGHLVGGFAAISGDLQVRLGRAVDGGR